MIDVDKLADKSRKKLAESQLVSLIIIIGCYWYAVTFSSFCSNFPTHNTRQGVNLLWRRCCRCESLLTGLVTATCTGRGRGKFRLSERKKIRRQPAAISCASVRRRCCLMAEWEKLWEAQWATTLRGLGRSCCTHCQRRQKAPKAQKGAQESEANGDSQLKVCCYHLWSLIVFGLTRFLVVFVNCPALSHLHSDMRRKWCSFSIIDNFACVWLTTSFVAFLFNCLACFCMTRQRSNKSAFANCGDFLSWCTSLN